MTLIFLVFLTLEFLFFFMYSFVRILATMSGYTALLEKYLTFLFFQKPGGFQ